MTVPLLNGACSQKPEPASQVQTILAPSVGTLGIDGSFDDWTFAAQVIDPKADGMEGGLDLGEAWVSDLDGSLLFRLNVGRETILQEFDPERAGADLTLHLDLDGASATGFPLSGMGVDLSVYFGRRIALRYDGQGVEWLSLNEIGSLAMPTHSASEFEFRISLGAGPTSAQQPESVRFVISDGSNGDRLPDAGYVEFTLSGRRADPVEAISLERPPNEHIRVLSHNTEFTGIARKPEPFRRLLSGLRPDLVALQEVVDWTEADAEEFFNEVVPLPSTGSWSATAVGGTMVLSRWPIAGSAHVGGENAAALVRAPLGEFVLVSVHSPCCANEEGRDLEHGLIAEQVRAMLAGSGSLQIEETTPVVLAGDFNTVGYRRQVDVLSRLSWDEEAAPVLAAVPFRHSHTREAYTWRKDTSEFGPGRLDWVFYTAERIEAQRGFAVWTPDLPSGVLDSLGLEREDSVAAADHLMLVTDFVPLR